MVDMSKKGIRALYCGMTRTQGVPSNPNCPPHGYGTAVCLSVSTNPYRGIRGKRRRGIWSHLNWQNYSNCVCRIRIDQVESSWNLMAHGDARVGKWKRNWRIEWVACPLHTASEFGISSITTADVHTSAASSRLNWRPCRFKWTRPFRRKTKSGFCACAIAFQTQSTIMENLRWPKMNAVKIWIAPLPTYFLLS